MNHSLTRVLRRIWHIVPSDLRIAAKDRLASELFGDRRDDVEPAVASAFEKVKRHTLVGLPRLATLYRHVAYLDRYGIEGDLIECGVWKGGATAMMALAHRNSVATPNRKLRLFDSWQGLPEPRAEVDGEAARNYASGNADGKLRAIGECVAQLDECKILLEQRIGYPARLIEYHQGWFQDTLPAIAPSLGPIALLRLDGDWYDSTKICLEHLYPKVVRNGVIHIDDYGHWMGCRRAVDEFLDAQPGPQILHVIDSSARYWLKA